MVAKWHFSPPNKSTLAFLKRYGYGSGNCRFGGLTFYLVTWLLITVLSVKIDMVTHPICNGRYLLPPTPAEISDNPEFFIAFKCPKTQICRSNSVNPGFA